MNGAFRTFLRRLVRTGRLEVVTADGIAETFGDGGGPPLGVKILDRGAERRLMLNPALALGELYMDGRLVVTKGGLYDLLALGARNLAALDGQPWARALAKARIAIRGLHQRNNRLRAKRNVASHYDLDQRLYNLFLDPDRQYSCAYFEYPGKSLEEAQTAKKRHLASKLLAKDGAKTLDIGCGFGGLALYLAGVAGANVTGVTLSEEQFAVATDRAHETGLDDRVEFRLQDYRQAADEPFDRIASMGMFEHVGPKNYRVYFETARRLLREDGLFLLHTIWSNEPSPLDPWIDKYIFPNGALPTVGQIGTAVHGLFVVEDVHNFGPDYDKTLMAWNAKFQSNRADVAALMARKGHDGERFCRMWEYYLLSCAGGFRSREISVGQFVLSPRGVREGYQSVR